MRTWKGKSYRVMVMADGFAHDGKTFTSLSEFASVITGTNWNGPWFLPWPRYTLKLFAKVPPVFKPMDCAWRSISWRSVWNSVFRVLRLPVNVPEADCVARVFNRSRIWPMLRHTAVHDLELRRGVIAVRHALGQFRDRAAELVGHGQTGRVVSGLVDPIAGG